MLTFLQERNNWLDALNSAIKATSPPRHYKLGDVALVWVPDTRVTMCHALVNRRHHCARELRDSVEQQRQQTRQTR